MNSGTRADVSQNLTSRLPLLQKTAQDAAGKASGCAPAAGGPAAGATADQPLALEPTEPFGRAAGPLVRQRNEPGDRPVAV